MYCSHTISHKHVDEIRQVFHGCDAAFCFKFNITRNQVETVPKQNWFFNKEKTCILHPPFILSPTPTFLPPSYHLCCCCLRPKIAQRKCSLLWQAGSSLLSCQATVERKVDGVSPASVSEGGEEKCVHQPLLVHQIRTETQNRWLIFS